MNKPLHPRHRAFVDHYLEGRTGAEAARLAGYSPRAARNTAHKLLQRPEIVAAVQAAQGHQREAERAEAIQSAEEAHRFALECGDASAAVGALALRLRLSGLIA